LIVLLKLIASFAPGLLPEVLALLWQLFGKSGCGICFLLKL